MSHFRSDLVITKFVKITLGQQISRFRITISNGLQSKIHFIEHHICLIFRPYHMLYVVCEQDLIAVSKEPMSTRIVLDVAVEGN
jgi:hypothetical protein